MVGKMILRTQQITLREFCMAHLQVPISQAITSSFFSVRVYHFFNPNISFSANSIYFLLVNSISTNVNNRWQQKYFKNPVFTIICSISSHQLFRGEFQASGSWSQSPIYSSATFFIQLFIMQPDQLLLEDDSTIFNCFMSVVIVAALYAVYRKVHTKKRLEVVRNRPSSVICGDKIIVACELDGLFVNISYNKKHGFTKVEMENTGIARLIQKVLEMFGIGIYFKAKASSKVMRGYLQTLVDNTKVQLFLYTTLQLSIAEQILQKLCLKSYFLVDQRRSCNDKFSEQLKHPTEVDFNTKRVIIVTGSKTDHLEEDSKYFLVVKRKELGDSMKILNRIIMKNSDIDELHNELGEMKAQIESDYESSC